MDILIQQGGPSAVEALAVRMAAEDAGHTVTTARPGDPFPEDPFMPIGSVQFCLDAMRHQGIDVRRGFTPYPTVLVSKQFIHRRIELMHMQVAARLFLNEGRACFLKPHWPPKAFDTFVADPAADDLDDVKRIEAIQNRMVWASEVTRFVSEWRYYVVNGEIVGHARYDDGEDGAPEPDSHLVLDAVERLARDRSTPAGYALDFGVLEDGRTSLVEANDGWGGLGMYKGDLHRDDYFRLLKARWEEIAQDKCLTHGDGLCLA